VFTGTEPGQPDCSGIVQEPRYYYSYTLDDPNGVKSAVMSGAGVGRIGL
jgi:pectate lyase